MGAAAMPVPTTNGTVAVPWAADRPSERFTFCPHCTAAPTWTPKGVVLAAVEAKSSVGNAELGCGTVTLGEDVVSVPVMPVSGPPGSLLRTVSVTASESPGEMIPSPPPTSLTDVDSWWMSSGAAEATAGSARSAASTASTTLRGQRPDLIRGCYRHRAAKLEPRRPALSYLST